jgi:hypothetical protein
MKPKHAIVGQPGGAYRERGRRMAETVFSRRKSASPAARRVAARKSARARRKP